MKSNLYSKEAEEVTKVANSSADPKTPCGATILAIEVGRGDGVDLSIPLDDSKVFSPDLTVDVARWEKMGVGAKTIEMVKRVGLVKHLLY